MAPAITMIEAMALALIITMMEAMALAPVIAMMEAMDAMESGADAPWWTMKDKTGATGVRLQ